MKAAYIEKVGPPENIRFGDLPKPKASGSQVLVKVNAVAVNPIDTYIRSGMTAMELPKPYVVGCDLAGVVELVGPDVARLKLGDRVWGSNQGLLGRQGTFAEFAAVEERLAVSYSRRCNGAGRSGIGHGGHHGPLGTVSRCATESRGKCFCSRRFRRGSFLRSADGTCGGRRGCSTTAGSDEKLQMCRRLGANVAINYRTGDIDDALRKFGPIDVWFENTREPNLLRTVDHLAMRGRIILIAGREARPVLPVGPFYLKDASISGLAMFNAPAEDQRKCAAEINRWLGKGSCDR